MLVPPPTTGARVPTDLRIDRALITGASAGIGAEFARQLADRDVQLVIVARRVDALDQLASELAVDVEVLAADLATEDGIESVSQRLTRPDDPIDLLVNNAGFGWYGAFEDSDPQRYRQMINLNVQAVMRLTHAVLPSLVQRDKGGVINVASTASFQPDPFGAVYGATKAFVRSFTEALHEELAATQVRMLALCPGVTRTEFQEVADIGDAALPAAAQMGVEPVVRIALADFTRGRAVSVPGIANALGAYGASVSPSAVTRRISGRVHRHYTQG